MTPPNKSAAANHRPIGQSEGSGELQRDCCSGALDPEPGRYQDDPEEESRVMDQGFALYRIGSHIHEFSHSLWRYHSSPI